MWNVWSPYIKLFRDVNAFNDMLKASLLEDTELILRLR